MLCFEYQSFFFETMHRRVKRVESMERNEEDEKMRSHQTMRAIGLHFVSVSCLSTAVGPVSLSLFERISSFLLDVKPKIMIRIITKIRELVK